MKQPQEDKGLSRHEEILDDDSMMLIRLAAESMQKQYEDLPIEDKRARIAKL